LRLILAIPEPENRSQKSEARTELRQPTSNPPPPATPVARLSTLLHFIPSPAGPMTAPPPQPWGRETARGAAVDNPLHNDNQRKARDKFREQRSGIRYQL